VIQIQRHRRLHILLCGALLLATTTVLGPGIAQATATRATSPLPIGTTPLPLAEDVASQGAELTVELVPDDWTPAAGATVTWTVTVGNRSNAAAQADFPSVQVDARDGASSVAALLPTLPPGWTVESSGPLSTRVRSENPLAPGASIGFQVASIVSAPEGQQTALSAMAWASNQWFATPRPGSNVETRLTVGGGSLEGRLVAAGGGNPVQGVCVEAQGPSGWWQARSRADGRWTLSIPGGQSVRIKFRPTCQAVEGSRTTTAHAGQWWPSSSTDEWAEEVELPGGGAISLGDTQLQQGAAVSGSVVVPAGFDPGMIRVEVLDHGSRRWIDGAQVQGDGTWMVHGLPPGAQMVRFADNQGELASEYYEDAGRQDDAAPVQTYAGMLTTGVDAELVRGSSIDGTVTDFGTGLPLEGIEVVVLDEATEWVAGTRTDGNGTYRIGGLAAGDHRVRFHDPTGRIPNVYNDGTWIPELVSPLHVAAGSANTLDMAMRPGVTVTGRVTAKVAAHGLAAGQGIPGVSVMAWPGQFGFESETIAAASTDADGNYTLGPLPPTTVSLAFVHGLGDGEDGSEGMDPDWAVRFWPGVSSPEDSGLLDLTGAAQSTPGIDAVLMPAPVLRGRVVDAHRGTLAASTGLEKLSVGVFYPYGNDKVMSLVRTGPDGSFEVSLLFDEVDVFLAAIDSSNVYGGTYRPRWYGNVDVSERGDPNPVRDGATSVRAGAAGVLEELHIAYNPPAAPRPPGDLVVVPGDGRLEVRWNGVADPVDRYEVLVDGVRELTVGAPTQASGADASEAVVTEVTGLVNGTAYSVTVRARNLGGATDSASSTGTPSGAAVQPPTQVPTTTTTTSTTTTTTPGASNHRSGGSGSNSQQTGSGSSGTPLAMTGADTGRTAMVAMVLLLLGAALTYAAAAPGLRGRLRKVVTR
jgi:hypothetical protein